MEAAAEHPTSAKGQRLTPKGIRTRRQVLDVALELLAAVESGLVSANQVAKSAGVSWGTMQHQFGDADGLWAAVVDDIRTMSGPEVWAAGRSATIEGRVREVVDLLWDAFDSSYAAASTHLRASLPREAEEFRRVYPLTAAAYAALNEQWAREFTQFFAGLDVDGRRAARVCALLPAALRGLRDEQVMSPGADLAEARRGLTEAITMYLATN